MLNMIPIEDSGDGGASGDARSRVRGAEARAAREYRSRQSTESRARIRETFRRLFVEQIGRAFVRETRELRRRLALIDENFDAFLEWVVGFYEEREFVRRVAGGTLLTLWESIAAVAAAEVNLGDYGESIQLRAARDVEDYVARYASRHRAELVGAAQAEAPAEGVAAIVERWEDHGAEDEAAWEVVRVDAVAALAVYELAGVTRSRWVWNGGECQICPPLNGRVARINANYLTSGETAGVEGAQFEVKRNVKYPPAHRKCECQLVADV